MFGVLILFAVMQNPWSVTPPRVAPNGSSAQPATPRPRLDIDLSGLSDDDVVAAPSRSRAPVRASAANREVVWSPRLNGVTGQAPSPPARPVTALAIAPDLEDNTPDRIDPAIADLIGSAPLPMVGSARRPRAATPARTLAAAPAPARRRYEPGRW